MLHFHSDIKDYHYSLFSILLAQVFPDGNVQCIGKGPSNAGDRRENVLELMLKPGDYILYVRAEWNQLFILEYIINAYTSLNLSFYDSGIIEEIPLITEIMRNFCSQYRETMNPVSRKIPMLKQKLGISSKQGFAYAYFYNSIDLGAIDCALINFTPNVQNLELIYPKIPPPIPLHVFPGKDAIILFRITGSLCTINSSITYEFIHRIEERRYGFDDSRSLFRSGMEFSFSRPPIAASCRIPKLRERIASSYYMRMQEERKKSFSKIIIPIQIMSEEKKQEVNMLNCANGHPLFYGQFMEKGENKRFVCNNCSKSFEDRIKRWNCVYCSWNLCENCAAQKMDGKKSAPPIKNEERKKISLCPKGHKLQLSVQLPQESYRCFNCEKSFLTAAGAWICEHDKYTICPLCIDEKVYQESSPVSRCLTCTKGHKLVLSTAFSKNDIYFCDHCRKRLPYIFCSFFLQHENDTFHIIRDE